MSKKNQETLSRPGKNRQFMLFVSLWILCFVVSIVNTIESKGVLTEFISYARGYRPNFDLSMLRELLEPILNLILSSFFPFVGVLWNLHKQGQSIEQTKALSTEQGLENKKDRFISLLVYRIDFLEKRRSRLSQQPNLFFDCCQKFGKQEVSEGMFDFTYAPDFDPTPDEYPIEYFLFAADILDVIKRIAETSLLSDSEKKAFKRLVWEMCTAPEKEYLLSKMYSDRSHDKQYKHLMCLIRDDDIARLLQIDRKSFAMNEEDRKEFLEFKTGLENAYGEPIGTAFPEYDTGRSKKQP